MQQYIFPAVLYKDDAGNGYTIVLQDINICTEGATVEEAFISAKEYLEVYCRCALEYNGEVDQASAFVDVKSDYNNNIVFSASIAICFFLCYNSLEILHWARKDIKAMNMNFKCKLPIPAEVKSE